MKRSGILICSTAAVMLLAAVSASAVCTFDVEKLFFSSVVIGETSTHTFTLTNDGGDQAVGDLVLGGQHYHYFAFDGDPWNLPYDLAPGESMSVDVTFTSPHGGPFWMDVNIVPEGLVDDEPDFVLGHAYGQQPPGFGVPDCGTIPVVAMEFEPLVVGGEASRSLWVLNKGGDDLQGAGFIYGEMPTQLGEFEIPWGAPYAITSHQTWDVVWRPVTPGHQVVALELPDEFDYPFTFEFRGLALVDGQACDVSVTDLDLGLVALGDTGHGVVGYQNMGDELLTLSVPAASGPFNIAGGPFNKTLAPGEELALYVEFTPTAAGIQTSTLDLGNPVCETVQLTGVGLDDTGDADRIGIWFEQSGTLDRHDTTTPFETVTAYLMILNPSTEWGALGWECCVEMVGDGAGLSWDLAGDALNVDAPPCFSVGLQSGALIGKNVILLATLTFVQPDPDSPTFFYIHPVSSPSVPEVAIYADGMDAGHLITLLPASGSETMPVAMVNAPLTGVPEPVGETALTQARPNPFNPSTTLSFVLGVDGKAQLAIHDMRGRLVRTLMDEDLPSGAYERVWNGRDDSGRTVESGVYFARLISGGDHRMMKVMLLK